MRTPLWRLLLQGRHSDVFQQARYHESYRIIFVDDQNTLIVHDLIDAGPVGMSSKSHQDARTFDPAVSSPDRIAYFFAGSALGAVILGPEMINGSWCHGFPDISGYRMIPLQFRLRTFP